MAIAHDSQGQGFAASGTSLSFAHACAGTDRILFLLAGRDTTVDDITGATYNGVAMTLIDTQTNSTDRILKLFYIVAPATGSNNVVISASGGSQALWGVTSSYTGVQQTGIPDAKSKQSASGTPFTNSVTTVADNCWTILVTTTSATTPAASTGSVLRASNGTVGGEKIFDSNADITPAGNYDMVVTGMGGTVNGPIGFIMASFAPKTTTVYTLNADKGTFVFTGKAAGLSKIMTLIAEKGAFILTGIAATFSRTFGWKNQTKNVSTYTDTAKNAATFTDTAKNNSSWINEDKH